MNNCQSAALFRGWGWMGLVGAILLPARTGQAGEVVDAALPLVIASSEITAMGGAGMGFATGASGLCYTPVAPVMRRVSDTSLKDASATLNVTWALGEDRGDLTNAGPRFTGGNSEVLANAGVSGRIGRLGGGLGVTGVQVWSDTGMARIGDGRFALATSALGGQLAGGAAARFMWVDLQQDERLVRFMGVGAEVGVSLAPEHRPMRLGAAVRTPVRAVSDTTGSLGIDAVRLPWQVSIGGGWANAVARDRQEHGRGARVGMDVVVYGPVPEGVALAPLLVGETIARGRSVSVSPRLGGELEAIPDRLRLRAGSYVEPSRIDGRDPRWHGTAGMELRVIHLRMLWGYIDHDVAIQSTLDLSERYQRIGWLGLSVWDTGWVSTAEASSGGGPPPAALPE